MLLRSPRTSLPILFFPFSPRSHSGSTSSSAPSSPCSPLNAKTVRHDSHRHRRRSSVGSSFDFDSVYIPKQVTRQWKSKSVSCFHDIESDSLAHEMTLRLCVEASLQKHHHSTSLVNNNNKRFRNNSAATDDSFENLHDVIDLTPRDHEEPLPCSECNNNADDDDNAADDNVWDEGDCDYAFDEYGFPVRKHDEEGQQFA